MNTDHLIKTFRELFQKEPQILTRAPGRVNLIGEHTDYNEGFVFPMDIDRAIWIVAARRPDPVVNAYSLDFGERVTFDLDRVERDNQALWSNYIRGVIWQYQQRGERVGGMDLVVSGDVPVASGLSSSAALEVATAETCRVLSEIEITPVELALLSQAAEREFVGVQCGIMDQFVSTLGRENAALFLDCRDLSYELVELDMDAAIVICDSRKQRSLESSEYNNRRAECEAVVKILNGPLGHVKALRDISLRQLENRKDKLPEVAYRRARHVVSENERVLEAVRVLKQREIDQFGRLMYESHRSLRDDYEVSCAELDILVELASRQNGTIGARMTGAGFGGCTVNLVATEAVPGFQAIVAEEYESRTGLKPFIYVSRPSQGVTHQRLT